MGERGESILTAILETIDPLFDMQSWKEGVPADDIVKIEEAYDAIADNIEKWQNSHNQGSLDEASDFVRVARGLAEKIIKPGDDEDTANEMADKIHELKSHLDTIEKYINAERK